MADAEELSSNTASEVYVKRFRENKWVQPRAPKKSKNPMQFMFTELMLRNLEDAASVKKRNTSTKNVLQTEDTTL